VIVLDVAVDELDRRIPQRLEQRAGRRAATSDAILQLGTLLEATGTLAGPFQPISTVSPFSPLKLRSRSTSPRAASSPSRS